MAVGSCVQSMFVVPWLSFLAAMLVSCCCGMLSSRMHVNSEYCRVILDQKGEVVVMAQEEEAKLWVEGITALLEKRKEAT